MHQSDSIPPFSGDHGEHAARVVLDADNPPATLLGVADRLDAAILTLPRTDATVAAWEAMVDAAMDVRGIEERIRAVEKRLNELTLAGGGGITAIDAARVLNQVAGRNVGMTR